MPSAGHSARLLSAALSTSLISPDVMEDLAAGGAEVQQVPTNSRAQTGDMDNSSPANFAHHYGDDPRQRDLFLLPNFVAPGPPRMSCSRMVHQRIQRDHSSQ